MPKRSLLLAAFFCRLVSLQASTPTADGQSDAAIARETSDPTSNLWYFYTELTLGIEPRLPLSKSNQLTVEFQPSLPVQLSDSWRLLNFPDLVLASNGTPSGGQVAGIESLSWLWALSPCQKPFGLSWGMGPCMSFPVATESRLAASQWQTGIGGVLCYRSDHFVSSVLLKSVWTTSGPGNAAGSFQAQYNLQYFFGNGMQVGLGRPRIEYNWNREGRGTWDVPVGVDFARVCHFGKLPVKIVLQYEFFAINDSRWQPEHLFQITFIPVLRSPQRGPIW